MLKRGRTFRTQTQPYVIFSYAAGTTTYAHIYLNVDIHITITSLSLFCTTMKTPYGNHDIVLVGRVAVTNFFFSFYVEL